MKRYVTFALAVAAVFAVLLAFTGAVLAAETIDFKNGEATLPVGNINIADGDKMKVKIELKNLKTTADGSKLTLRIGGLRDVVQDLKLKSFTVKLSSTGIDNSASTLSVSTGFIPVTLGDFTKMEKGLTITEDTAILGIHLLGMINDLVSVTVDVLPTAPTASVTLDITANIEEGIPINPMLVLSKVDVSKLTGNPNVGLSITSGTNSISNTYVLDTGKEVVTPIPTPTVTPTLTATATTTVAPTGTFVPTVNPTVTTPIGEPTSYIPTSATQIPKTPVPKTPVPVLVILGALTVVGCGMVLRRK